MAVTKITKADISRFTEGDCHVLARAIHLATGWDFAAFWNNEWGWDVHAFVLTPGGFPLDVLGLHTDVREFLGRWRKSSGERDLQIKKADHEKLFNDWMGVTFGEYSVRRAKTLVPVILKDLEGVNV